jgi:hypothetical protein
VRERTGVDVLITSFCQFSAKKLLWSFLNI